MKEYKFEAEIHAGDSGGAYVFFPHDVEKEFGTKGRIAVKATFDGVAYRGSLSKCGPAQHMLGILKSIQEQIDKRPGETIDVVVWPDDEERTVAIPPQFKELMKKEHLLPFFEPLSYTHRKEYCRWITEAKKEETRAKRLAKAVEMLKQGVRTPG